MSRRPQFTRKLILYRNGDPSFKPLHYLYNNQRIRTFEKLLEDFDGKVPPLRGGAVKNLYTVDGDFKLDKVEQLEGDSTDLTLVVGGSEPFRPLKGGYENIGRKRGQATPPKGPKSPPDQVEKGKFSRPPEQRIHNRKDPATETRKIAIVRCGDSTFGPRPYILRMRYAKSFAQFIADVERFAPPTDTGESRLFSIKGEEVTSLEEIETGMTYAIGGDSGFVEPRGGFPGHGSVTGNIRRARSSESVGRTPAATPRGSPRPASERVYNRHDQIKPQSILIFLFLNGEGLKARRLIFTQHQLQRGWPWFMEQLGKVFGVYPKKLRCMDGREVNHVDQLIQKGAYVLVPLGQNFRDDKWYYLPDRAVDTSAEATGEEQQGNERPITRARRSDGAEDDRTESARNSADSNGRYDYDEDYYSDQDEHRGALSRGRSRSHSNSRRSRQSQRRPSGASQDSERDEEESELSEDDDRHGRRRDSSTLDEDEEDWAGGSASHGHHHHHKHHGSRRGRSHRLDSACSYCDMLEAHLSKHHSGKNHQPKQRGHSAGARRGRVKENVRSVSPSPNRRRQAEAGTGRRNIVSRKSDPPASRGDQRLSVSHNNNHKSPRRKDGSPRRGSHYSQSSLRRTNSEGGLFYARHNADKKGQSPYNIRRDESSPFGAKNGRRHETQGAREVRESGSAIPKKTKGDPKLRREYSRQRELNF